MTTAHCASCETRECRGGKDRVGEAWARDAAEVEAWVLTW